MRRAQGASLGSCICFDSASRSTRCSSSFEFRPTGCYKYVQVFQNHLCSSQFAWNVINWMPRIRPIRVHWYHSQAFSTHFHRRFHTHLHRPQLPCLISTSIRETTPKKNRFLVNPVGFWIEKQSRFSQIYVPVPIVAMTMKSQQAFLFLVVRLL